MDFAEAGRRASFSVRARLPGFLTCAVIAMASTFISEHYGGPTLLFALLFGIALHFLSKDASAKLGIEFTATTVLRVGVGLLGARISAEQIAELGLLPVALVGGGIALTFLAGHIIAKILKLTPVLAVLTAGAVAICGASAAIAISAVLPKTVCRDRNTLFTVIAVTSLSTAAMVLYPLLVPLLSLDENLAGMLFGSTIHDVAQVVGAGHIVSDKAAAVATYVKLMRVAMLIPVVVVIASLYRGAKVTEKRPLFPWFLVLFAGLAVLNSVHMIPQDIASALGTVSRWCLICAIAALGIKTSLEELKKIGWRAAVLIVGETLILLAFVVAVLVMASV